jgi:hypothetical protein
LLRLVKIISEWQNLPEPYIEFDPLQQMSEKEQAELEKLQAEKDQFVANTYKTYIDMGAMDPYEARFLQFGDSLDKIPVPEEDMLPPVETVPEGKGEQEKGNEGQTGAEGEDEATGEEKQEGGDKDGEGDGLGEQDDDPGDDGSNESGSTDKPGSSEDTKARIAELEEKEELTEEEKKELAELKKKAKDK